MSVDAAYNRVLQLLLARTNARGQWKESEKDEFNTLLSSLPAEKIGELCAAHLNENDLYDFCGALLPGATELHLQHLEAYNQFAGINERFGIKYETHVSEYQDEYGNVQSQTHISKISVDINPNRPDRDPSVRTLQEMEQYDEQRDMIVINNDDQQDFSRGAALDDIIQMGDHHTVTNLNLFVDLDKKTTEVECPVVLNSFGNKGVLAGAKIATVQNQLPVPLIIRHSITNGDKTVTREGLSEPNFNSINVTKKSKINCLAVIPGTAYYNNWGRNYALLDSDTCRFNNQYSHEPLQILLSQKATGITKYQTPTNRKMPEKIRGLLYSVPNESPVERLLNTPGHIRRQIREKLKWSTGSFIKVNCLTSDYIIPTFTVPLAVLLTVFNIAKKNSMASRTIFATDTHSIKISRADGESMNKDLRQGSTTLFLTIIIDVINSAGFEHMLHAAGITTETFY
jgi:hypothetical protein